MARHNQCGSDFGSEYMLRYFADYVNDWTLLDYPELATEMLCCIHDGYRYREGLISDWNTDDEFKFFDLYNLLEDEETELDGVIKRTIRYFKKDFVDTFLNEDWYRKSLEEAEEDEFYGI